MRRTSNRCVILLCSRKFGGYMNRIPLLLALFALSSPAFADDDFFLWKVFAGEYTSYGAAWREVTVNTEDGVIVSDFSDIPCNRHVIFGIGYNVIFESFSPARFDLIWHFPHLADEKGKTSHSHKISLQKFQKKRFRTSFAIWELDKDELKDGDFTLILYRGKKVFLQHVFRIRGCNSGESDTE